MHKCIVADDSKVIRGILVKTLSNLGFEVFETDNGDDVLNLYLKMRSELKLIIMDYTLPSLNGIDVLYKIRERERNTNSRVSIILSSATVSENVIKEALDGGADDYLMRPFDADIISSKLELLEII